MALLDDLIEDAKSVAAYGQRSGRLRDNELSSAIAAIERLDKPNWTDPAAVALQTALDRAINNIAPTTLADLKDPNWAPFAAGRSRAVRRTQLAFVIFSLVLLLFTGFSTLVYKQGASIVGEIDELLNEKPRAAVSTILRQLNSEPTIDVSTTQIAADETYNLLVEQLQSFDDRYSTYRLQANKFLGENPLPHDLPMYWWRSLVTMIRGDATYSASPYAICDDDKVKTVATTLQPAAATGWSQTTASASAGAAASLAPAATVTAVVANEPPLPDKMREVRIRNFQVFCAQGLSNIDFGLAGYMSYSAAMQWWISAWGLLYLPALYGAFGATMYYMRRILDPTLPDPTLFHFIHRVALGAFAGVIVTWFWAPSNALTAGFTSVGLTLFTVAFIVGFSVDILFALLERFVNAALAVIKGADRRPNGSGPYYVSAEVAEAAINAAKGRASTPAPAPAASTETPKPAESEAAKQPIGPVAPEAT